MVIAWVVNELLCVVWWLESLPVGASLNIILRSFGDAKTGLLGSVTEETILFL